MKHAQPVDHLPDTMPKPRGRRWLLWLGVPLVLFVLWLVLLYAFFAYWMDHDLRAAMAAADRDSPAGWQLEDIEAHRERIPDEENAALVVMKVKSLLPAAWPFEMTSSNPEPGPLWDEKLIDLPPEVQLDAAQLRDLRASLGRVQPARAEVRKLISMARGRFPLRLVDNVFLITLNSQDARTATNLLRYETTLASQDGDADETLAFVRGMLGAARSVGDEPFIISALIRLACDAQALAALERALAQGEPSIRALQAVQALLEKEAAEPLFVQALRGERASLHKLLLSMRHGTASLSQVAGPIGRSPGKGFLDFSGPTLARYSHAHILEFMNQYVEAAKLPPEQQPPTMDQLFQKVRQAKTRYDIVTALVMPAIGKVAGTHRRSVGNLRCAFVALALER